VACINAHCGITPDYAGSSPFDWASYERRFDDVGYTLHLVVPEVDSGPVIHQERVSWDRTKRLGHLWPMLAQRMYDKSADTALSLIAGESVVARPQGRTRINPPAGLFARLLAEWRRWRYASTSGPSAGR